MTISKALEIFRLSSLEGQSEATLKKIYYNLAQVYHPDKGGTFELFVSLQEAHLLLKKSINKQSFGQNEDYDAEEPTQPGFDYREAYDELTQHFNRLREHYRDLVKIVEKYENIFNSQIRIINHSNNEINQVINQYHQLRDDMQIKLDLNLAKLKKKHHRAWWEYVVPTTKLTQEQFIKSSNRHIEEFNRATQSLDDEFISLLLKKYKMSFQDIVSLLSDV